MALVTVVIIGISWSAIDRLQDLADDQGLSRVQVAAASVREDLRQLTDDTLTAARTLAARPTLERLWREQRLQSLKTFLERFCQTSGIDGCAVVAEGRPPLLAGKPLDWDEVLVATEEQGDRLLISPAAGGDPMAGATAVVPMKDGTQGTRVILVRILDNAAVDELSKRSGLQVRLRNYGTFADEQADDFTPLHSAALANGRLTAERIDSLGLFASSYPLFANTGEPVGLIETRLPVAMVESTVEGMIRRLIVFAIVLGVLAGVAGIALGRRVADPVRALTVAATRLGQGDFSTSIPVAGTTEVRALAGNMEDMRRSLVELTGALRRGEAEAQAVLNGIVEGVYAVDRNRRIRYLNPQAATLLGVSSAKAVGQFCGDVLHPEGEGGVRPCENNCPILKARAEGSARATERLVPRGGPVRTAVITSSAMVDELQVQVIRDETELEGVRRARDSVLANISHEFRTPLAAQLASIELLRDGLDRLDPEARRELVMSLQRGTVRLTRLIDNLLESVRIESGQLAVRRQPVTLPDVIEQSRELIEPVLVQRRQNLLVELPESLPTIEGDSTRLTQVFVNLLANASKFAPEGSSIRIGARSTGREVETWVEDEGPGVPDPADTTIFERFYRGRDAEPEPAGLGLGLWIVRSIIQRHGGEVRSSRTPDNRTRFTIILPVVRPA